MIDSSKPVFSLFQRLIGQKRKRHGMVVGDDEDKVKIYRVRRRSSSTVFLTFLECLDEKMQNILNKI